MKYIITQLSISIISVIFLLYFFSIEYFVPKSSEVVNWYNISFVLLLIFLISQSIVSVIFFLVEKKLTCGVNEYPNYTRSFKWGIILSICLILSLLLSIFNVIPLLHALLISSIIVVVFNILKLF